MVIHGKYSGFIHGKYSGESWEIYGGVQNKKGVPKNGWFRREIPTING